MKQNLPNVTLITIDGKTLPKSKIVADICEEHFSFGAVKILSYVKDDDKRVVPIPKINSMEELSSFYIKEVYKYIDTDYALFFHPDGFILNPSAWDNEFLKYDYIGAPWYHFGKPVIGNGGFSLRSKRLMEYVAKNYKKIGGQIHPEDSWICRLARKNLEKAGMKFAPIDVASRFSKEGNTRGIIWNGEFGWHGANSTDISKWLNKNPKYKNIFSQEFDPKWEFLRKYMIYDGTFHVIQCKPIQVENYKKLAKEEKDYDCRMFDDIEYLDEIKIGHKIIYMLFRISTEQVGIPTFEKEVKKIEKFSSKKELLKKYPHIQITPTFHLPKWRQRMISIFGNIFFPNRKIYTLFWFK